MSAVSALLPVLPQAYVRRLMNCLETRVDVEDDGDLPLSLTWPMVHEMRRGGITIAHTELAIEKPEAIKEELEGSKRVLEADLIRLACAAAACLGLLWFAEDRIVSWLSTLRLADTWFCVARSSC